MSPGCRAYKWLCAQYDRVYRRMGAANRAVMPAESEESRGCHFEALEGRVLFNASTPASDPFEELHNTQATLVSDWDHVRASESILGPSFFAGPPYDPASTADRSLMRHELVFIETSVPDHQRLIDDIKANQDPARNLQYVLLQADGDGIQTISETLAGYHDLDAVRDAYERVRRLHVDNFR